MTTLHDNRGQDPLDPATYFGPVLGRLLTEGCRLSYAPDPVWDGFLYAEVRKPDGWLVNCGSGVTADEALRHLRERLERDEPGG